MQCWISGEPAAACCRFCGRCVAEAYRQNLPFFLAVYVGAEQTTKVIVVKDAVWCGVCRPQPEPIELPELY
ncbi:MAG: hypothetical protein HC915_09505 [Anaerolineae bacterium]|nr:hypothetical protein [Anaerolineae bacterium]